MHGRSKTSIIWIWRRRRVGTVLQSLVLWTSVLTQQYVHHDSLQLLLLWRSDKTVFTYRNNNILFVACSSLNADAMNFRWAELIWLFLCLCIQRESNVLTVNHLLLIHSLVHFVRNISNQNVDFLSININIWTAIILPHTFDLPCFVLSFCQLSLGCT